MKLIKDTVHGYISIPEEYCSELIDTEIFQRLRRIEQTSIRSIFPCARHDRFIHSIGTYHLGKKAIETIITNFNKDVYKLFTSEKVSTIKQTFEIACLLHDCGHSPFSHTLEYLYSKANNLDQLLIDVAQNKEEFKNDLQSTNAKEHEKVSAFLVLKYYKDKIQNINSDIDADFVARMIMGCKYKDNKDQKNQIKNEIISLLNGRAIDVDKLDYTARDRWASGYTSSSIDLERLISAFRIIKQDERYHFCVNKSALSEIDGVLDSRNFQYMWIISHHKVMYDQHILEQAIKMLGEQLSNKDNSSNDDNYMYSLKKMFDVKMFFSPQNVFGETIYLLSDDDIMHLLKKYEADNRYAKEWFSRKHILTPLWKSYAEYYSLIATYCSGSEIEEPTHLEKVGNEVVKEVLRKADYDENNYFLVAVKPKVSSIKKNELYININNSLISYSDLGLIDKFKDKVKPFIYIYIPKEHVNSLKEEICRELINRLSK